jgi:hypothetical protein
MDRAELNVDEMRWGVEPVAPAEGIDVLGLDESEIFAYARDLQQELESLRLLPHESLSAFVRVSQQRDRALKAVVELRDIVRKLRGRHERADRQPPNVRAPAWW